MLCPQCIARGTSSHMLKFKSSISIVYRIASYSSCLISLHQNVDKDTSSRGDEAPRAIGYEPDRIFLPPTSVSAGNLFS